MKKILMITLFAGCISTASCQDAGNTSSAKTESTHAILYPDANTFYLDDAAHKIDAIQFSSLLKTGQYTFEPKVKNGKVESMQLQKKSHAIIAGNAAPGFSVTDIQGKHYSLEQLKGKIVVLNFWFTNCFPCVKEIPQLNGLVKKYQNNANLVFLAITFDGLKTVENFLSKTHFNFNIVAGEDSLIKRYNITGYPTSMVIDGTGSVAFALTSYDETNVQQLDGVIEALSRK